MKKVFLSISIITLFFTSCEKAVNLPAPYYDMEGKWTYGANNSNTMYLYEDGLRYTYYCGIDNCDSLYNTYTAGDSNHIPEVLNYTFENEDRKVLWWNIQTDHLVGICCWEMLPGKFSGFLNVTFQQI